MEMISLTLPATNRFATDYENTNSRVQSLFDYEYKNKGTYEKRCVELQTRSFQREALADVMSNFMESYPSSLEVTTSINKLRDEKAVVVIGGQQAGLLTGPLYTIHKIISIISFSRQKEKELGIPVIPLFWIAGEDHDHDEINHVYVQQNGVYKKYVYPEHIVDKKMVSHIPLQEEVAFQWVKEIVGTFGETAYTNELLLFTQKALQQSKTVVDFFAYIVMSLFKDFGLLIVDSGDENFRQLQTEHFIKQIQQTDELTECILQQQLMISELGYDRSIIMHQQAANLFYYENNQRMLLQYDQSKQLFFNKQHAFFISKNKLLEIANHQPEKLSANVAARPLVQEQLFPTLAFIAGPGEIAYWAELTTAFHLFDMKMPPVVPRLNITIVDRATKKYLTELQLDLQEVLTNGTNKNKQAYLQSISDPLIKEMFTQTEQQFTQSYGAIAKKLAEIDRGLLDLLEKNKQLIETQINYMKRQVDTSIEQKHEHILKKYNHISQVLRPLNCPQERIVCGYYYLNLFGFDFMTQLTNLPFTFDGKHKVVFV